jgi:hypothetical protein
MIAVCTPSPGPFSIGSQSRSLSPEEKRSRIILANGEFQASKLMNETAKLYGEAPVAIKLKRAADSSRDCQREEPHNSYSFR